MYPADVRLSPDGRWLSYGVPQRTGMFAGQTLYLSHRPFLETRQAIAEGDSTPRWRSDGRELFYLSQDCSIVGGAIENENLTGAPAAHVLFRSPVPAPSGVIGQAYDVAPDGERFVLKRQAGSSPIQVSSAWSDLRLEAQGVTMRRASVLFVILAISLVAMACGHSSPVQPSTSTATPAPGSPRKSLEGRVSNTASQGVPGAVVAIVDGPGAGQSVTANESGVFKFAGEFPVGVTEVLRTTKAGYFDVTVTALPVAQGTISISVLMKSTDPAANLSGRYIATFTAAADCSAKLPEDATSRSYEVSIVPGGTPEQFSGMLFVSPAKSMPFNGAIAGSSVAFWFGGDEFNVPGVLDDLGSGYFYAAGEASTTVSGERIAGTLTGTLAYCPREMTVVLPNGQFNCPAAVVQTCSSSRHQILLSPR